MIFTKINSWLNKQLPFFENTKQKLVISVAFGFFIMLFLFFSEDPPANDTINIGFLKIAAYGSIAFFSLFFFFYFSPLVMPKFFHPESWNVGKNIVFGLILIIAIGLLNSLFSFKYDNPNNRTAVIPFIFAVVYKTFIISIIPSLIFNFWLERRLYKKYYTRAIEANKNLKDKKEISSNTNYNIEFNNNNEITRIPEHDFIYIKSEGNYCQIFYHENSIPKKLITRNTLKNLEKDFNAFDKIQRCHKSYIVNLNKVNQVKGNARGYFFIVDIFNFPIPVSRDLSKDLIARISL